jgi:hypothetical protein
MKVNPWRAFGTAVGAGIAALIFGHFLHATWAEIWLGWLVMSNTPYAFAQWTEQV